MKISPSRIAAVEILTKIEKDKAFSSVLLPQFEETLATNDRALCHALVLGVLRNQIYLDALISKLSGGKKIDSVVKIILRIALFQIIFLDKIPPHAVLNDAVNLTQKAKKTSAKGFVNAILRRFQREKIELNFADEIEKLSIETSHPRWLIEKWIGQFGIDETAKLAIANNQTPKSSYRWTAKTTDAVKKSLEKETDAKFLRELAENGKIYFQEEGSQMVGNVVNLKENDKFLDVCAAPGSKTTQVISNFKSQISNLIVAGDFNSKRTKILKENCERQGAKSVNILQYDAEESLPFADESFDVILVDAPCSGTGTIRHNPEIRYFLEEKDFENLARKQLKILINASKLVRSGGHIIYSTCSLEIDENEAVANQFLSENSQFEKVSPLLDKNFITDENFGRTFPPRDDTDGFFIAVFCKK